MNKRPHPGGLGLPAKPYIPPGNPGPAPPLPPGPPPPASSVPQQQQQQPIPQQAYGGGGGGGQDAAHAAAWAAYYASQGVSAGTAYIAAASPQVVAQPQSQAQTPGPAGASLTPNPYANYGYGAGASIPGVNKTYSSPYQAPGQAQVIHPQPVAGPSQPYNYASAVPGGAQTPYAAPQQQPYGAQQGPYNPQISATGYQPPQPAYQAPAPPPPVGRAPYNSPQQGQHQHQAQPQQAYGVWNAQNTGPTPPYRPPQQPAQQQYPQSHPQQQPFYAQQQQNRPPQPNNQHFQNQQSFRPPAPTPNRPYQPGPPPQRPSGPSMQRPPMQGHPHGPGGQGSNFPPAKRPRFDGPGGGAGPGPMNGHGNASPVRPGSRPPFGMNGNQGPSAPSNFGGGGPIRPSFGRPPNPPPIHLGSGPPALLAPTILPPQRLGFGAPSRGGLPLRGGLPNRGGGGGGGGRGMAGAPRGPAGMRRPDSLPRRGDTSSGSKTVRDSERRKREKERTGFAANGKDGTEKEQKTTMTDFRIVGIEFADLGWSWGLVSGKQSQEEGDVDVKANEAPKIEVEVETSKSAGEKPAANSTPVPEVPVAESEAAETAEAARDAVEEKRGEKRKAKTNSPDGDEESEIAFKKRASAFQSTHQAEEDSTTPIVDATVVASADLIDTTVSVKAPQPPVPTHESSQNRFRIYFESPPELDRIPKSLRKGGNGVNPNKRWRRESSSVAPSRVGDVAPSEEGLGEDKQAEEKGGEGEAVLEGVSELLEEVETEIGAAEGLITSSEIPVERSEGQGNAPTVTVPDSGSVADVPVPEVENASEENQPEEEVHLTLNVVQTEDDSDGKEEVPAASSTAEVEDNVDAEDSVEQTLAGDQEGLDDMEHAGDVSMRTDGGPTEVEASASELECKEEDVETAPEDETKPSAEAETADHTVAVGEPTQSEAEVPVHPLTGAEESAAELAAALVVSAQNTASAYSHRPAMTRRWSESSSATHDEDGTNNDKLLLASDFNATVPSTNRLSILYEDSSRRLCFDADVVDKVRIYRAAGKIEIGLKVEVGSQVKADTESGEDRANDEVKEEKVIKEEEGDAVQSGEDDAATATATAATPILTLPRGILVETYDNTEQRFVSMTQQQLADLYTDPSSQTTVPPLHRVVPLTSSSNSEPLTFTVYMNLKKPLSEPKWCRANQADDWLLEQFGKLSTSNAGWRGKLEIVDPDPPPTLQSILEGWITSSSGGPISDRRAFTGSLLSDPNNLLEILLKLTRGDRNPTTTSLPATSSSGTTPSSISSSTSNFGALASAIRPDSPYASHQTHVSLAILAMYRLTTDYADKAGEKRDVVDEKIGDIIKSLPVSMICRSLDGLFKEWVSGKGRD